MNTETVDFYDGLAADCHLVYGDSWDEAVTRQGAALARLIHGARPDAVTVLDCSCGIGTQAIGLAREGFRVTGTDISEVSIVRARVEAARLGADVELGVADFRDLRFVPGLFDVVLSADNALPHLLDDANVENAEGGWSTARSRVARSATFCSRRVSLIRSGGPGPRRDFTNLWSSLWQPESYRLAERTPNAQYRR